MAWLTPKQQQILVYLLEKHLDMKDQPFFSTRALFYFQMGLLRKWGLIYSIKKEESLISTYMLTQEGEGMAIILRDLIGVKPSL